MRCFCTLLGISYRHQIWQSKQTSSLVYSLVGQKWSEAWALSEHGQAIASLDDDNHHHHRRRRRRHHRHHNDSRIQRRNSRFLTISSLRCELSPTRTLKWPGRNRVKITCNTSSAYHVHHVLWCATWHAGTAQLLSLTEFNPIYLSFIILAEPLSRLRRGGHRSTQRNLSLYESMCWKAE